MPEPSSETFHRQTPANLARTYFYAVRPAFLSASLLPVLTALAYVRGVFDLLDYGLALLTLVSVLLIHSAANVFNDYFDSRNGSDANNDLRIFPFSGGSRFIQNGVLSEQETFRYASVLLVGGIVTGLLVTYTTDLEILLFGVLGVALAVFYSAPPCLACKGLGDLTIVGCFGVLPVTGSVYAQIGEVTAESIWLGLVVGCFVAAILWINSIPDIEADIRASKNTWPVRLNQRIALRMHGLWFISGFGLILFTSLYETGYLALLAVVPAVIAVLAALNSQFIPAIPLTLLTHAAVCILLGIGFLV